MQMDILTVSGIASTLGVSLQTVRTQALVLQGARDVVSQPAHSQTLARLLGPQARYLSLDAGHELLDDALRAWPAVESAILEFAQRVALARAA